MAINDETTTSDKTVVTGRIARGMRQAIRAAQLSDGKQMVGAAVYVGSKCVSAASNSMSKSDPKACGHYAWPFPHAEFNAIKKIDKRHRMSDATVYIVRLLKSGKIANSKPCRECSKMLKGSGVGAVYFTGVDGTVRTLNLSC
jgi:tRNA(Arg) A34 adenosine deaminase TadA